MNRLEMRACVGAEADSVCGQNVLLGSLGVTQSRNGRSFAFQAMEPLEIRINAVALIHQPIAQAKSAYVLVNNRSEGNASKTIQSLVDQLQATKHAGAGDDHLSRYIK